MRRRKISFEQQLAAALACLLPQAQRDELRALKVPAKAVIRLFSPDHIGLHCFDAPDRDEWHNLTPILRGPHKEKSRNDCAIAAKVKRLERQFRPEVIGGMVALVEVIDRQMACQPQRTGRGAFSGAGAAKPRPKRKLASRPFPKRQRPMRWKDAPCP